MRGASLMLGTLITLTIAAASQAAMVADFRAAAGRAAVREQAVHQTVDPVWYGGQLPPVVVEVAPTKAPAATAHLVPRNRAVARAPRAVPARIS
jgi:hypothetical protein